MTLQRLWSHYDLALDYIGGVGYYNLTGEGFVALQQMDIDQKITWKRGELSLRDSFSYLPGRQLWRVLWFDGFAGNRVAWGTPPLAVFGEAVVWEAWD